MVDEKTKQQKEKIIEILNKSSSNLLHDFPIDNYISTLQMYPTLAHYNYVNPKISEIISEIKKEYGSINLERYNQLVLVTLIQMVRYHKYFQKLPKEVTHLIEFNLNKILKKVEGNQDGTGYYLNGNDKFQKDLSICLLRMIPLGAQKVTLGKLSRGFLMKGGLNQFISGIRTVLLDTGGFAPIYHMHMDSRDRDLLKEFNLNGWVRFYKRLAELLIINSEVKGVTGSSWFFDPVLKEISPELSYLRETAFQCGAKIFYMGPSKGAVKDATFMSPKRLKLYEEGSYKPSNYIAVISRDKLIKWAFKNN